MKVSKTQCESLEIIQRQALRIIFPVTNGMPHILALATHKLLLSTLAVKKLINDFSGPCLTLPLVFSPYCLHPETALLLLESDLQQSDLQLLANETFYIFVPILSAKLPINCFHSPPHNVFHSGFLTRVLALVCIYLYIYML